MKKPIIYDYHNKKYLKVESCIQRVKTIEIVINMNGHKHKFLINPTCQYCKNFEGNCKPLECYKSKNKLACENLEKGWYSEFNPIGENDELNKGWV
ncbi:MAG: hypothetical protein PHX21_12690 [bacterium]|nr:hypothetical protein [bacterium]